MILVNGLECLEIAQRQRLLDPFAAAAERIVRQHPHDGLDVAASGAADGDGGARSHDGSDGIF
jgi:hypothetical protein